MSPQATALFLLNPAQVLRLILQTENIFLVLDRTAPLIIVL